MNAESASEQQLQASYIECGPPICPRAEVRVVEDVEEAEKRAASTIRETRNGRAPHCCPGIRDVESMVSTMKVATIESPS
jgi:hypothetical protein